ncbi:MAG: hypothetical protein L0Y58_14345 [Verrucomicrobia subdivision 3 bacterium]|nr:hypothetical protein [Limisphaerales bacterium]
MSSAKQYKLADTAVAEQRQVVLELQRLVQSIERCETTITELRREIEAVQAQHQSRKTTQEDIAYLSALLKCAQKKLGWEKQLESLKRKTPVILEKITALMNDPRSPPSEEMRGMMVQALQGVGAAMERLDKVKTE